MIVHTKPANFRRVEPTARMFKSATQAARFAKACGSRFIACKFYDGGKRITIHYRREVPNNWN